MRIIVLILSVFIFQNITAQETKSTEKIFSVVEQTPRFPGCEGAAVPDIERKNCADRNMLGYIYQNIQYPQEALDNEIEGRVVIRFVVEKDGSISNAEVVKDIGGGCGAEAVRIIGSMNELEEKWTAGLNKGVAVRTLVNLPIKFKIEKAPEYFIDGRDTVWVQFDTPPVFDEGIDQLDQYLKSNIVYPKEGNDSCLVGVMDCSTLIRDNGQVLVLDIKDYNDLGFDYQGAATKVIIGSMDKWQPAVYQNRKVTTGYDIRLTMTPDSKACANRIEEFESSYEILAEGIRLYGEDKKEEALVEYNKALALFPQNAEFLLLRGQALLEMQRVEEACKDLKEVKRRLIDNVYNNLIPLICIEKEPSPEEVKE